MKHILVAVSERFFVFLGFFKFICEDLTTTVLPSTTPTPTGTTPSTKN
jgi:hypothetical protein